MQKPKAKTPRAKKPAKIAPSLPEITKGIAHLQKTLHAEGEKFIKAAGRWSDARKYSAVEIGWQLLRAIVIHRADDATRFKVKSFSTGVESFSTPEPQALTTGPSDNGGFYAWLAKEHADIEPRTARNYMNAARNAGLTAESTPAQVRALRKKDALAGIGLAKLYRSVEGDAEPQQTIADQAQARRLMAELAILHGRSGLLHRVDEIICQNALFAELSAEQIERLYHKLAEATDKVDEHRPPLVKKAA